MVGRLSNSNTLAYDAFGGGFIGSLAATTITGGVANYAVGDKYKNVKPSDAIAEQPETLPELKNLVFVSAPDALGAGFMFYVTKVGGKEVVTVVSNPRTAELYGWAVGMSYQFSQQFGSFVDGLWTVKPRSLDDVQNFEGEEEVDEPDAPDEDDDKAYTGGGKYKPSNRKPELADIEHIGDPSDFTDVIRYAIKDSAKGKYGGDQYFYATKADHAETYAYVVDGAKILTARDKFKKNGYKIADNKTIVPHRSEVKPDTIKPVKGVPGTLVFEMKNGDKYFVNEELSSSLYGKLKTFQRQTEALDGIDAPRLGDGAIYNQHITKVELNNDGEALPEGVILVTLKGHPTYGDGTYIVTEADNSQAYDVAMGWYQYGSRVDGSSVTANDDDDNVKYGGGGRTDTREFEERFDVSRGDWDIMSEKTGERVDPDNDKSPYLTVGELAMKKLREKYEEEAEADPDGKAAKFIALLDAVAAYSSGRSIQAYTQGEAVSSISGQYYVPSEDWQGVIDYEKLMSESNAIWQDPDIQEAYSEIIGDVIADLDGPSMEERAKKILSLIVGDPEDDDGDTLALWLADMKEQGREGEAELIVQGLWNSLAYLDKPNEDGTQELLDEALSEFQLQALNVDLGLEMEKGIGDDAYTDAAVQSNLTYILALIKASPNLMRLMPNAVIFNEAVLNGKIPQSKINKIVSALSDLMQTGAMDFGEEQLEELFKKQRFLTPDERQGVVKWASEMNKAGLLGSFVGGVSLGVGVARLTHLDTENTKPEDFLLITRDFLSFLSFSEHYAKGIGTGVNKVAALFGKDPNLIAYLGLNSSLPEIWGRDGKWGKHFTPPNGMYDTFLDISSQAKVTLGDWTNRSQQYNLDKMDGPENRAAVQKWMDHFNSGGLFDKGPVGIGGTVAKTVGSIIKIVGNGLDAPTGIIDIVFNALKLSKANGDPYTISSAVFGLLGGVANTAAGVISGVNALFRTLTFASMSSPLFIVGTVLGVISALIEIFVGQRDTDKKLDAQRDWLNGLADAGVIREDGFKAFEFINTWYAYAKGRNDLYDPTDPIPEGLSIFDYDRERWDRFKKNWEPGELPREVDNFFNQEEERSWWANEDEDLVFEWDFGDERHNPGNKISPDHPAAKEYRETRDDLAEWYTDHIDLTQSPVQLATFGNATPKKAIEEMADFYLTYIDASADSEDIAEWIKDELTQAVAGAYDNEEDGERAAGAIGVHFDKNGGKEDMVDIINGTFVQSESPRAQYENTLNTIVSIYADGGISTEHRTLFGFNQDNRPIKALMKDLIEYYFQAVKLPSGEEKTAETAASWAIEQVKGRIGIAFRSDLDSDDDDIVDEAEEKIEIFMNYVNKDSRNGKKDALAVAEEVYGTV